MTLSDALQLAGLLVLPVGIGLVFFVVGGLLLAAGAAAIVLAPVLWFIGREIDLQREVPPR